MQTIGPYQVVRELGRGGMGVVYEVRHPQIPRPLALKLLLDDQASADSNERFRREAEMLARVRHPNVVGIHGLESSPRGMYLVSDLVEGESLKDRLSRGGALESQEAAKLLRALADAVVAVHGGEILHRDLKPDNVIVRPDGSPVLLDFGIARDETAERLTRTGTIVGTPAYMSPEQAEGVGPDGLDARTDVYGLGAVLFSLLSGRPPFEGTKISLLKKVLLDEPRWPSLDSREVALDLEAICRHAMAKAPDDRYPSAEAMRDDLDRFLGGQAVLAPAVSRRSNAVTIVAIALIAVLVAGGAALGVRSSAEPPPDPRPSTAPNTGSVAGPPEVSPEEQRRLDRSELLRFRSAPAGAARVIGFRKALEWLAEHHDREVERVVEDLRLAPLLVHPRKKPVMLASPSLPEDYVANGVFLSDTHALEFSGQRPRVELCDLLAPAAESRGSRFWEPDPVDGGIHALVHRSARTFYFATTTGVYKADATGMGSKGACEELWRIPPETKPTPGRRGRIRALAISPDSSLLAVGGDWVRHGDHSEEVSVAFFLLDLSAEGRPRARTLSVGTVGEGEEHVGGLAFSPDGRYLVSASKSVQVWDVRDEERRTHVWGTRGRIASVGSLAMSSTGVFAAGDGSGFLKLFRVDDESATQHLRTDHKGAGVTGVVFSPNGGHLYSISRHVDDLVIGKVLAWDVNAMDVKREIVHAHEHQLQHIALSPDGALLLVGTRDGFFEIWGAGD